MKTNQVIQPQLYFSALGLLILAASCAGLPRDTVIDARSIPTCSPAAVERFEFARDKMEGMVVENPTNHFISFAIADEKSLFEPKAQWKPVNGEKMILCGKYHEYLLWNSSGSGAEHDWNLKIIPDSAFSHIISDARILVTDPDDLKKWHECIINGRSFDCLQAEITPDESFYDNEWFPDLRHNEPTTNTINPRICVYGPWVLDRAHGWRPEIHPSEVIWWREKSRNKEEFYVFGIQDDSNRYDDKKDFKGDMGEGWKPWAVPPITSQIKIPFEYSGQFTDHLIVTIEELRSRYVVTPAQDNSGDSDSGKNHILKFSNNRPPTQAPIFPSNILVEVNETQQAGSNLGVRFVDMCRKPNGNIIGYIQIFMAFGKGIDGDEGYQVLKVTLDYPVNKIPDIKAE